MAIKWKIRWIFEQSQEGHKSVVQKEAPKTTVSLRFFEKEEEEANEVEDIPIPIPIKGDGKSGGLEDYDSL